MKKRMLVMLLSVGAFLALIGGVKVFQIRSAMAAGAAYKPAPEAVTTIVAQAEQWPATLNAIGTVEAVQGVTVSADLPGIVDSIHFRSGQHVEAGALLARLDSRQEQAQLVAAKAQHELAHVNLARARGLGEGGIVSQADFDQATVEDKQAEARLGEIRATLARKEIRAPFSGWLGIRQANVGQYLHAGDAIVTLQALHPIHVNFGVPQQELGQIAVGQEVRVATEGTPGAALAGRITAIDAVVDPATRNVQIQATLANPHGRLKPGMFVRAEIVVGTRAAALAVPASAISYAPYGDSVFVVEEMKDSSGKAYKGARQQFVKVGEARGDQVAVLSGIEAGDEVVTSGAFKLRNGATVQVNNEILPANDPSPRPEDN